MQKTLDSYSAGVQITQVQLQKVDPPQQVIDAFRDVQAARADLERAQNEAQTYANRVVPEARGRAAQITQDAEAYREQTVAEATGQTSRFIKVYDEYKKAPEVTRQRMYLETMERLFGGTDKIILDSGSGGGSGVVPYLPLNELTRRRAAADGRHADETRYRRRRRSSSSRRRRSCSATASLFTVHQTQQALVVRLGQPVRVVTEPGLHFKMPLIDNVIVIDKRILDLENAGAGSHRLRPEAARGRCLRALPHQDPLRFYQTVGIDRGRQLAALDPAQLGAAPRARRGHASPHVVRDERAAADGAHPRAARPRGAGLRHQGRRRAHPPRRPAGAEQPGGLPAHADRAPARGGRVPRPGQPARAGNPRAGPTAT